MNENLMVNSKTDILEFKRKHNLLVGKGTIKTTVSNIKQLTNADIENLSCGDVVLKEDSSGKHSYLVSFKSDKGLCLTYCDASCVETQSYDKVGNNWVYNSQDLVDLTNTKPLYCHPISIDGEPEGGNKVHIAMLIFDNSNEEYNTWIKLRTKLESIFSVNENAVFPITGAIYYVTGSTLHIAQKIAYGGGIKVLTARPDGTQGTFDAGTTIAVEGMTIYDGVNKIN